MCIVYIYTIFCTPINNNFSKGKVKGKVKGKIKNKMPSTFTTITLKDIENNQKAKRLKPPYRMILIYLLNGYSQTETSRFLGYSNRTISWIWCNHEGFKEAFEELSSERDDKATSEAANVRRKIDESSVAAQECLADLIGKNSTAPDSVKHSASKTILEMAGHKAPDRVEITHEKPLEIKVSDDNYNPSDDLFFKNHPDKENILKEQDERVKRELEELEKGSPPLDRKES